MKRQLRHLVIFACITATAALGSRSAFAGYGSAEGGGKGACCDQKRCGGGKGMFRKMARQLNLTDQQKKQAHALLQTEREKNAPLLETLRNERRQLQTLVRSGSADEATIRAQSAKVAALQADLAVERAAQARQFLALLTPEQAAKFKEMRWGRGDMPYRDNR